MGPIPVGSSFSSGNHGSGGAGGGEGKAGKEVISRFRAPALASEGVFYSDANGREFQRRVRNRRTTWDLNVTQPVAGNYFPVTAAAFLRDEGSGDDGMQVLFVVPLKAVWLDEVYVQRDAVRELKLRILG